MVLNNIATRYVQVLSDNNCNHCVCFQKCKWIKMVIIVLVLITFLHVTYKYYQVTILITVFKSTIGQKLFLMCWLSRTLLHVTYKYYQTTIVIAVFVFKKCSRTKIVTNVLVFDNFSVRYIQVLSNRYCSHCVGFS